MKTGETGKYGELTAARFLRRKGYRIVTANYRTRFGEVDIIAADAAYIVFAEVKTRRLGSLIEPREAVDAKKRARIIKAAAQYLSCYATNLQPRFDVIEVRIAVEGEGSFRVVSVNHIENAFTLEQDGGAHALF